MKLYHFTAKRFVKDIKKRGLLLGSIPISLDPPVINNGYQWLTSNESFDQPSLVGTGALPYSKTEVRMSVVIPDKKLGNLLKFDEHKELTPLYDDLTILGDPENWYVYRGMIPRGWIRRVECQ